MAYTNTPIRAALRDHAAFLRSWERDVSADALEALVHSMTDNDLRNLTNLLTNASEPAA